MSSERRWLQWLLPEIQLSAVVQEFGWTRKAQEEPAQPAPEPKAQAPKRPPGHVRANTDAPAPATAPPAPEADVAAADDGEVERLMTRLTTDLRRRLSLQRDTVPQLVEATRRWLAGRNADSRPAGVLLIAGVSGSGKGYVAKQFVQALSGLDLLDSNVYEEINLTKYDGHDGVERLLQQRLLPPVSQGLRRAYVFAGVTEASPDMMVLVRELCRSGEVRGSRPRLPAVKGFVILMSAHTQVAYLENTLGVDLWTRIHQPILLPSPDAKALAVMAERLLQEQAQEFHGKLGVRLSYRTEVFAAVGARALADGLFGHSVQALVEQIDAAIRELHAKGSLQTGYADVGYFDSLSVTQGFQRYTLPVDLRAP